MNMIGRNGRVLEKTLSKMREVSVRVFRWSNAFIHLHDVNALPWELFIPQGSQHDPGSMAAADGQHKTTTSDHRSLGLCSDRFRGCLRSFLFVIEDFNQHCKFSFSPAIPK